MLIWDVANGRVANENLTSQFEEYWWTARYSPDGNKILLRGSGLWPNILPEMLQAKVVDASTGELLTTFMASDDENWFRDASWSPDGSQVATAQINGEIHIWDYETGELITTLLHGDNGFVNEVEWSPDGSMIASASDDSTSQVWDTQTWETILVFSEHEPPAYVGSVDWSPDGTRIMTTSGNDDEGSTDTTARIWDPETGEELFVITGHTRIVLWGEWSPDGTRIATSSQDNTTRVWDAATGEELLRLDTPNIFGPSVKWSPDGKYIATSGYGQQSEIWRVWQSTEELIDYAEACCVFRELTPAERTQFGLAPIP